MMLKAWTDSMPTSSQKGSEFFTEHEGKREDAHLHEPILQGIKTEDHKRLVRRSRDGAKKLGISESALMKMYD